MCSVHLMYSKEIMYLMDSRYSIYYIYLIYLIYCTCRKQTLRYIGSIGSVGYIGSIGYIRSIGWIGSIGYIGSIWYIGSIGYIRSSGYSGSIAHATSEIHIKNNFQQHNSNMSMPTSHEAQLTILEIVYLDQHSIFLIYTHVIESCFERWANRKLVCAYECRSAETSIPLNKSEQFKKGEV